MLDLDTFLTTLYVLVDDSITSQPPADWQAYHAHLRQIVEVAHSTWTEQFRLDDERPHALDGFLARLAAIAALHNACIWINRQLGREPLAFADLIDW